MTIWLDAHLPPMLADWIASRTGVDVFPLRRLALQAADDQRVFDEARQRGVSALITKDQDFVRIVEGAGPPPTIVWITCGNTSNARLTQILDPALPQVLELIKAGEPVLEIGDAWHAP